MKLDAVTDGVLSKIDDLGFKQEGAFNLRYNGQPLCHGDTEHIKIRRKEDKQGIDVYISREAQGGAGAYSCSGIRFRYHGCGIQ